MFGYLKVEPKKNLCFDTQHPAVDERYCAVQDWYYFYRYSKEAILEDAPTPRGNVFSTNVFVDADHDDNRDTRISHTGS